VLQRRIALRRSRLLGVVSDATQRPRLGWKEPPCLAVGSRPFERLMELAITVNFCVNL